MWVFPASAAVVAAAFAALLARQFLQRRRSYQAIWALALLMYAVASVSVALGAVDGWSSGEFRVYWALGAVLNVPFLAQGELDLLVRVPGVRLALYVLLVFVTAYTIAVVRTAAVDATALAEDLPAGREVFGAGTSAQGLPRIISTPAYLVLVGGTLWSAWRMRGRPELRDRFWGTLLIASACAALGHLLPFSVALLVGISVMFAGFLRASRPAGRASTEAGAEASR
jgi:hypothetical protein